MSATHVLNGVTAEFSRSSADQNTFAPRVMAMFHDAGDRYGNTVKLSLKNP